MNLSLGSNTFACIQADRLALNESKLLRQARNSSDLCLFCPFTVAGAGGLWAATGWVSEIAAAKLPVT